MAKISIKRNNIRMIIAAIIIVAVIVICACIPQSGWDYLYKKAGLDAQTADCEMSVHFIDVGQGDCTLIKLKSGETAIIDSGEEIKADTVKSYLKKEKVKEFDYCFVTHPHTDHYAGMTDILKACQAKTVVLPSIPQKLLPEEKEYAEFTDYIKQSGCNVVFAQPGEVFGAGDAEIKILGPLRVNEDLNAMSLVIKISLGDASFIITGDCTQEEEQDILSNYSADILKCSVLKAGHHGSAKSTCEEWLDMINPDAAVISVGKNNEYNHPAAEMLRRLDARGIKYYRTDYCGDIVFKVNDDSIETDY